MLINTILFLNLIVQILLLLLLVRNSKVANYRKFIVNEIYQYNITDLKSIKPTEEETLEQIKHKIEYADKRADYRYDLFNRISYNEMLFRFWRPVNSFYNLEHLKLEE